MGTFLCKSWMPLPLSSTNEWVRDVLFVESCFEQRCVRSGVPVIPFWTETLQFRILKRYIKRDTTNDFEKLNGAIEFETLWQIVYKFLALSIQKLVYILICRTTFVRLDVNILDFSSSPDLEWWCFVLFKKKEKNLMCVCRDCGSHVVSSPNRAHVSRCRACTVVKR